MPSLSRALEGAHLEVLEHGHAPEQAPAFRRLRDAGLDDLRRAAAREIVAVEVIVPLRGRIRPEIVLSVVDLPAPLAPRSVTISPSPTTIDTPLSAWIAP